MDLGSRTKSLFDHCSPRGGSCEAILKQAFAASCLWIMLVENRLHCLQFYCLHLPSIFFPGRAHTANRRQLSTRFSKVNCFPCTLKAISHQFPVVQGLPFLVFGWVRKRWIHVAVDQTTSRLWNSTARTGDSPEHLRCAYESNMVICCCAKDEVSPSPSVF